MSTTERRVLMLAGGLAMVAVGRHVVTVEGKALGLSTAELIVLSVLAASLVSLIATTDARR